MSSTGQLYQKTIEGFLASLERLEAQQFERATASEKVSSAQITQTTLPVSFLNEQESQLLEEAVADIEQVILKRRSIIC